MTQAQSQAALPNLGSFSSREIYILVGLMVPTAMSLIDAGMLAVALPVIQTEFAISIELLAWAVAAAHISRVALLGAGIAATIPDME